MKYSYLPEAHNDYILAIIGEEVGFLGTLLLFLVFAMLIYSAFRIAEQATDRRGALMASGSAVILAVQFLINALGILNVFPMTGKPLPFISYGARRLSCRSCSPGLSCAFRTRALDAMNTIVAEIVLPLWTKALPVFPMRVGSAHRVAVLPS